MSYNNKIEILKESIKKRSDVAVIIPTFRSFEITKDTISRIIKKNVNFSFDILIVDNQGFDFRKILEKFPTINYIILKNNVGSSGSHYIAVSKLFEYGYKYYCLSDNDAYPIDKNCIKAQIEYLKNNPTCGAVLPHREGRPNGIVKNSEFHFFMTRRDVIKKVGLPNKNYFLSFDDIDYSTRVRQKGYYIFRIDKRYYHPFAKTSSLFNISIYFRSRGVLIFLFSKQIFFENKIEYFFYFLKYIIFHSLHSIILLDFSIIKTLAKSFSDFFFCKLETTHERNKFSVKPIDEDINAFDFNIEKNRLFLYYGKKFVNKNDDFQSYFQIFRTKRNFK